MTVTLDTTNIPAVGSMIRAHSIPGIEDQAGIVGTVIPHHQNGLVLDGRPRVWATFITTEGTISDYFVTEYDVLVSAPLVPVPEPEVRVDEEGWKHLYRAMSLVRDEAVNRDWCSDYDEAVEEFINSLPVTRKDRARIAGVRVSKAYVREIRVPVRIDVTHSEGDGSIRLSRTATWRAEQTFEGSDIDDLREVIRDAASEYMDESEAADTMDFGDFQIDSWDYDFDDIEIMSDHDDL